ncbi:MAG: helix-turn-helix transcriptional regulator [Treponema sp.]|nr:helix-turn-helix transcriptional regulator [Treponema sp.]
MIVSDPKSFGQAVRRYRKMRGATQVQLAGVANTGLRFIIDLEKGKPTVQLGKALRVAYVLGIQFEVPGIDEVES